ncbi:MAG TPA: hypothetical protein VFV48_00260 [Pseudomonadales bacterium]|nr:hypothetical protein [Pseudomonadales bacterium]
MFVVPHETAKKVFDALLVKQYQDLFPHMTMGIVQKLMAMMQGPSMDMNELIEELELRKTQISVDHMIVRYKTPPVTLITAWIPEDGNYKLNDFTYKPNWFWLLLNFSKVKRIKEKMEAAKKNG